MSDNFSPGDLVHARGREWVVLPHLREGWLHLRPLSGSEREALLIDPVLELEAPRSARFRLPADARMGSSRDARLLSDAIRLSLRRGAGPFRSAAALAFEPRAYQLVPLLMALRLQVPRLLIADDVGIGKTIEAGLILRELMDRGEVDRFAVLCPPHLVEQWVRELEERFGIEATAVTASSARRLERGLPVDRTIFDAHPATVVSLDYIKSERRRDSFATACPPFVIVDEAHTCVGSERGRHQRYELLRRIANKEERGLILLTATPHSGDEQAFGRLLGLISPEFSEGDIGDQRFRRKLARHFVQRRREDLEGDEWGERTTFPKHIPGDLTWKMSPEWQEFHDAVLDWCTGVVERVGSEQHKRRLAFWGTLALMRCVGSSAEAALGAMRTRAGMTEVEEPRQETGDEASTREEQLFDKDGDDEGISDVAPQVELPESNVDSALADLIAKAEGLTRREDPKAKAVITALHPLLDEGARPVLFCRYIATAEALGRRLKAAFPDHEIEVVTGRLTPDERRERVEAMASHERRILVATDCLSEGINLQLLFDTVIHYDLSWNPTRHQQREGRVNRFGQPADCVRSLLVYSPDSAIDGAVLDVILRKAQKIREDTGVTVPLPDERGPVTDALMHAMLLKRGRTEQLDLFADLAKGQHDVEIYWHNAEEAEKRTRSIFAQRTIRSAEVIDEWKKAEALLGTPEEALAFVDAALTALDAPPKRIGQMREATFDALPRVVRERLSDLGLTGTTRIVAGPRVPSGAIGITRAHPLVSTLADVIIESALAPDEMPDLALGRQGAWPTAAVDTVTRLALLRIRYRIETRGRMMLAEEAVPVALDVSGGIAAHGSSARSLLDAPATGDLHPKARERVLEKARDVVEKSLHDGELRSFVNERAKQLAEDHARLRRAVERTDAPPPKVSALHPADLIGLFVLLPDEGANA